MVALELDVLKAAYDGQVHHLVCHKGWRHCEKNRRTMEHEHPHHSIDAYNFSWFAQQILASFIDVIFSFHCLGYSWRHSILTSRKYKTLTIRLKKTVSWRAKTLTMSAPDFVPALVEPEHFSHLGTVWKFVVVDQYTIGLRCSQGTQTVEIDISTLGCKGNRQKQKGPSEPQVCNEKSNHLFISILNLFYSMVYSIHGQSMFHSSQQFSTSSWSLIAKIPLIHVAHAAKQPPIEEYLVQRVPGSQVGYPEPQPYTTYSRKFVEVLNLQNI